MIAMGRERDREEVRKEERKENDVNGNNKR